MKAEQLAMIIGTRLRAKYDERSINNAYVDYTDLKDTIIDGSVNLLDLSETILNVLKLESENKEK